MGADTGSWGQNLPPHFVAGTYALTYDGTCVMYFEQRKERTVVYHYVQYRKGYLDVVGPVTTNYNGWVTLTELPKERAQALAAMFGGKLP